METPGTRSGRWLPVLPSGSWLALRLSVMLTGRPALAVETPGEFPTAEDRRGQAAIVQKTAALTEGQLIDGVRRHGVPYIDIAYRCGRRRGRPGSGTLMLSPEPIDESAMPCDHMYWVCHRNPLVKRRSRDVCQRIEIVVAVVGFQTELENCARRSLARSPDRSG